MHTLTQMLSNAHSDGQYITLHEDNADKIITTYLRDRAEWLKKDLPPSPFNLLVDQAFELSPECRQCNNPMEKGLHTCKPKPALPSKFEIYGKGKYDPETHWRVAFQEAFNQIIDYLKAKQ